MPETHPGKAGPSRLHGRRTECAVLDDLVLAVRGGESRTLVVRGEAGVGKSALLEYVADSATQVRLLRASGVESEMELAFAALHQLCAPILDRVDGLPGPQRDSLRTVFGLSTGPPPDQFLVGLAVLSLLSEVADQGPTLCLVDDAQWLDRASARTFGFVARRLRMDPVGLLLAAREPGEELRGLPELELQGLHNGDARALLGSVVNFEIDERVRDRIVAETRGNPLALLELPQGMSRPELAGGFGLLPGEQALSGRIEESFLRRLEALPAAARSLLLVAAAEPVGDPILVWGAADRLGAGTSTTAAEEAEGLLSIRERVTFRHPLVRSAIYRSATAQDRRAAHLALAEVTDADADPDRRAWHRASGTAGLDEDVAAELERSAGRAQARGGFSAAAAFLQRSVALTADPVHRAERALAAAQASLAAGAFDVALRLLGTAEQGALDELQAARVDLLRGQIAFVAGLGLDAPPLLMKAAQKLVSLDLDLARETYLNAWGAAAFAGPPAEAYLQEISRRVQDLPPAVGSRGTARPVDLLLEGLSLLVTDGWAGAAPTLHRAISDFSGDDVPPDQDLRWGWMAAAATYALWDIEGARTIFTRRLELVRGAGALGQLPIYLVALGAALAWSGDFSAATSLIVEADEVTAATGIRLAPYNTMLLHALRGEEAEASALIATTLARAADEGQGIAVTQANWTASVLYNGLGRYQEALAAARAASADPLLFFASMWALPELVEAAVRSGEFGQAKDALDRLVATTQPCGNDVGLGLEARSRALLAEGEAAETLYRAAIERLGRTRLRPEIARAHLLYGEWLRREGRRVHAREQLRTAHETFAAVGMQAFAERARRELLATGEKVRKRSVETPGALTPQEQQIAVMARDGMSNPEIGARLFISPRTVEWHLRKVFDKLGISSRKGLRDALPRPDVRPVA